MGANFLTFVFIFLSTFSLFASEFRLVLPTQGDPTGHFIQPQGNSTPPANPTQSALRTRIASNDMSTWPGEKLGRFVIESLWNEFLERPVSADFTEAKRRLDVRVQWHKDLVAMFTPFGVDPVQVVQRLNLMGPGRVSTITTENIAWMLLAVADRKQFYERNCKGRSNEELKMIPGAQAVCAGAFLEQKAKDEITEGRPITLSGDLSWVPREFANKFAAAFHEQLKRADTKTEILTSSLVTGLDGKAKIPRDKAAQVRKLIEMDSACPPSFYLTQINQNDSTNAKRAIFLHYAFQNDQVNPNAILSSTDEELLRSVKITEMGYSPTNLADSSYTPKVRAKHADGSLKYTPDGRGGIYVDGETVTESAFRIEDVFTSAPVDFVVIAKTDFDPNYPGKDSDYEVVVPNYVKKKGIPHAFAQDGSSAAEAIARYAAQHPEKKTLRIGFMGHGTGGSFNFQSPESTLHGKPTNVRTSHELNVGDGTIPQFIADVNRQVDQAIVSYVFASCSVADGESGDEFLKELAAHQQYQNLKKGAQQTVQVGAYSNTLYYSPSTDTFELNSEASDPGKFKLASLLVTPELVSHFGERQPNPEYRLITSRQ